MSESTSHITTSGGLFPAAFVHSLRELNLRQTGIEPHTFTLPWSDPGRTPAALEETIAAAWELLLERWDAVRSTDAVRANAVHGAAALHDLTISEIRNRWLLPLFQLLDFDPQYLRGDTLLDDAGELRFPLSHRGWQQAPPGWQQPAPILHTEPPAQALDARAASGRGPKAKSPHDMLQLYLNLNRDDRWAILSNGLLLRLLRDYHHTFSKGYVQFDLEAIFETRNYGDFRALFRLCHASRFYTTPGAAGAEQEQEEAEERRELLAPIEHLYRTAQAAGVKVGEDLRGQVRQAIEILGNGFLHGAGAAGAQMPLHHQLQDDAALTQQFYGDILRVIYRILFLLFAEQRGLLPHAGAPLEELYNRQYSISALRRRAEGLIPRHDDHTDLWHGLQATFRMVRKGAPQLGVFGYNGMLFDEDARGDDLNRPSHRSLSNSALLQALRRLTLVERDGVLVRISYADLGVEELGSIYESLLDYTPRVTRAPQHVEGRDIPANTFYLDPRGLQRKSSGSYYTHPALVNELIRSALLPVMRDRLQRAGLPVLDENGEEASEAAGAIGVTGATATATAAGALLRDYAALTSAQRAAGEEALLALNVCDPAAGSGHFLVKANNAIAAELARIRSGDDYPAESAVAHARRDVLTHCIYAVDLNPMAVELCKVSLWINASVADRPLSFLDHHIKLGNSLIGAAPQLLEDGVPYDAFALGRAGDDREVAKAFRAQNRQERRDYEASGGYFQPRFRVVALFETEEDVHDYFRRLEALADVAPNQARERYREYLSGDNFQRKKLLADFWTAAFFWPLTAGTTWAPTFAEFKRLQVEGPDALPPERLAQVQALAAEQRFFHWYLEFPDVFDDQTATNGSANGPAPTTPAFAGGFDVILGNPPWERIKLQENEFFADKAPEIADAKPASRRRKLVAQLPQNNPVLHIAYQRALHFSEAYSSFLRDSGRYPLSAVGDINTYQIFSGLARQIADRDGRAGIIVQSGIATDYYNQDFFADIVNKGELVSFYDFVNTEGIFPGIHRTHPHFCLLTLAGPEVRTEQFQLAFWCTNPNHLAEEGRIFSLSPEEIRLINPNTQTLPVFRSRRDAELTKKLYRAAPVLHDHNNAENPWGVSFFSMFHMTNDSHLFHTAPQPGDLRLYEAKMFHQFNHRWATYEAEAFRDVTNHERLDPRHTVTPRYYVAEKEVKAKLGDSWQRDWLLAFRNITNTTNERTMIITPIPISALGNSAPTILLGGTSSPLSAALVMNFCSYSFDFLARQKMGGTNLNFYIVEQLPVLPPETYTPVLLTHIVPRVLELTYTAWDIKAFADDLWAEADGPLRQAIVAQWQANATATGGGHRHATAPEWLQTYGAEAPPAGFPHPPFMWHEERRAHLRADLDALYAHLYGLNAEELAYILDTFPIVRRKDEAQHGEYRTKRLVLEKFEEKEWET